MTQSMEEEFEATKKEASWVRRSIRTRLAFYSLIAMCQKWLSNLFMLPLSLLIDALPVSDWPWVRGSSSSYIQSTRFSSHCKNERTLLFLRRATTAREGVDGDDPWQPWPGVLKMQCYLIRKPPTSTPPPLRLRWPLLFFHKWTHSYLLGYLCWSVLLFIKVSCCLPLSKIVRHH